VTEPRDVGGVLVFDLRDQPHRLSPKEWTPHVRRDQADLRGVALHAWGVRSVGTEARLRRRDGEPLALARRALATPYGISCGVTERGGRPVVAVAHPLERYTMASDCGNAHYLAVGIMGLFAFTPREHVASRHTPATDALRAAVAVALEVAVDLLAEHAAGPFELITHRQCANGSRDHFACPGEAAVEMALASPAARDGLLVPDPDLRLDPRHGLAWPDPWRRHLQAQAERPVQPVVRHLDVPDAVVRDEA
jgi:hypothetical protein